MIFDCIEFFCALKGYWSRVIADIPQLILSIHFCIVLRVVDKRPESEMFLMGNGAGLWVYCVISSPKLYTMSLP